MAKPLKTILKKVEPYNKDYVSPGDEHFMSKHEVEVTDDANGNDDDVFKAANVDTYERNVHHHGYDHEKAKEVYEEVLDEGGVVSFDASKKKPSTLNIGAQNATVQKMPNKDEQAEAKKRKFLKALGINPDDETFKAAEARLKKLKDGDK